MDKVVRGRIVGYESGLVGGHSLWFWMSKTPHEAQKLAIEQEREREPVGRTNGRLVATFEVRASAGDWWRVVLFFDSGRFSICNHDGSETAGRIIPEPDDDGEPFFALVADAGDRAGSQFQIVDGCLVEFWL